MKHLTPTLAVLALMGCNQPPTGGMLTIGPEAPSAADDLIAEFAQPITDDNDDTISLRWAWFLNGAVEPAHTSSTIPSAVTRKGQVWRVEVTPNDGKVDGLALSAETTVLNTPPTATVTLAPEAPRSDQNLVATVQITDLDEDETGGSRITWTVDGVVTDLPGTEVQASETERGQTWKIEVVPADDEVDGESVSAEVVIANVTPVADAVRLNPEEAFENTRIVAIATGSDHDNDTLEWTYTWYVNGGEVKSGPDDWLDGDDFSKLDNVMVEATASDSFEDSNTVTSEAITVLNTPPVLTGARLEPGAATEETTITCVADGANDIDGDTVTFAYRWTVNRRDVGESTSTLDGEHFGKGQEVSCTITPNDGTADGGAATSGFLTIGNTAPSLTSATINPATPRTNDTLTASATGVLDIDDDRVTLGTEWYVNKASVSKGSTLGGTAFKKGDKVEVKITPYDGDDYGTAVTSAPVTIANTPPVVSTVTLTPNPAYTTTPLSASVSATDADSDRLSNSYAWYVNSVRQGGSSATLDKSRFSKGQRVYVTVTVSDGTDSTTKTSVVRTISNSAPSTPSTPRATPPAPKITDNLVCTTTASADADSDRLTYRYQWLRDGVLYGTYTSAGTTHTLPSSNTGSGQAWTCRVQATDGTDTSSYSAASAPITTASSGGDGMSRASSGISCLTIKTRYASSKTGHYWIDPDGDTNHSDAKQVYCDMVADGGGWTMLAWTGNSAVRRGSYYWGVPYPGTDTCGGTGCGHGSFLSGAQTHELFDRSTELAKAQGTTITSYQPMLSYTAAGKYNYGSLSGLRLETSSGTCSGYKTGTFTSIKGATTHTGTTVYLAKGLRYGSYNYGSDFMIFNVGVPTAYCSGNGSMPGTWVGSWSSSQYGPASISSGAHAIWVR